MCVCGGVTSSCTSETRVWGEGQAGDVNLGESL